MGLGDQWVIAYLLFIMTRSSPPQFTLWDYCPLVALSQSYAVLTYLPLVCIKNQQFLVGGVEGVSTVLPNEGVHISKGRMNSYTGHTEGTRKIEVYTL